MCFFALVYKTVGRYPLIVAANRDEFFDRAATDPLAIRPGVIAGRDLRAGGTWLGVTRRGLIVAMTNRHREIEDARPQSPAEGSPRMGGSTPFRSRGLLCLDLLDLPGADGLARVLAEQVRRYAYDEFNVVAADRRQALAASYAGGTLSVDSLAPGVHILANTWMDNGADPKVARGRELLTAGLTEVGATPDTGAAAIETILPRLEGLCRDHGTGDRRDAICVHNPSHGTLSSSIIAIGARDASASKYLFASGPPCTSPYRDLSHLLTQFDCS